MRKSEQKLKLIFGREILHSKTKTENRGVKAKRENRGFGPKGRFSIRRQKGRIAALGRKGDSPFEGKKGESRFWAERENPVLKRGWLSKSDNLPFCRFVQRDNRGFEAWLAFEKGESPFSHKRENLHSKTKTENRGFGPKGRIAVLGRKGESRVEARLAFKKGPKGRISLFAQKGESPFEKLPSVFAHFSGNTAEVVPDT
jgi:hypothetical protein